MGQYWDCFNFDKREVVGNGGKLGEFFFDPSDSNNLLHLVIRPPSMLVVRKSIEKNIGWKEPPGKCTAIRSLLAPSPFTLDKLPSELILVIFEHLEDLWEVIMFALTCSTFWIIGQQRLCAVRDKYIMFWSGCRISCLGEYTYDPPRMINKAEYEERHTYETQDHRRKLYGYFVKKTSQYSLRSVELHVVSMLLTRPRPASPVLRNLTKHEYIREDIDMMGDHVECSFFGRVLLAHICWSSDPSFSMEYDGDLHQGKWAGDRIDCVELQDLDSALDGQLDNHEGDKEEQRPWKDITSEAYGFLHDIYNTETAASSSDICCRRYT